MTRVALLLCLGLVACGSDTPTTEDDGGVETRAGNLSVTLLPMTAFGCSTQFSMDVDGSPFGRPAEMLKVNAPTGPAEAEVRVYRTDEPPEFCPPSDPESWLGATGDVHEFDPPLEFGPGTAVTLRIDCATCEGNEKFTATFELRDL